MEYKLKTYIPFSNGTEMMIWFDNNCDACKRSDCYAKRRLHLSMGTGSIPLKRAEYIGYHRLGLNAKCNNFTDTPVIKRKQRDTDDEFKLGQLKCF
jgi:hypothetical protein